MPKIWDRLKFLNEVRKLPSFEVRTRKLQKHSTYEIVQDKRSMVANLGLCENCRELVENNCEACVGLSKKKEKGIDVMIAVDMLENAIKNNCDACILISGDADFVPVLNLIHENGKEAFSSSLPSGYSYELRKKFNCLVLGHDLLVRSCLK